MLVKFGDTWINPAHVVGVAPSWMSSHAQIRTVLDRDNAEHAYLVEGETDAIARKLNASVHPKSRKTKKVTT